MLRGVDLQIGLTRRIAAALSDRCHQSYVSHSYHDILTQCIYQIGCGYEDGNDCVLTQLRQFFRDEIAIDTVEFVVGSCLGIRELMGVFD
ncbi:transposase [Janthinobacterium sp. HLX7-2]|uniref:transposase n=1 Tax=Janthinobacterium sp. HLX7-2 TaxID=1259331 RepID=UPI003F21D30D